ncbi:ribonuclease H-like domain-containing protein [Tanacetum coccineum]
MGFITGACSRSDYLASAPLLDQWDRCNVVVLNWILTSLSQDVYLGHVFSDNAAKVWNDLKETYDRVDGSIVFNMIQKINSFKQGSLHVVEYYHKLNSLWKEFDALTKLPDCTCEARNEVVDHDKLMKLMQFLMGLDDVYQPIRSSILTRKILPEAKDAFVIISREESLRGSGNWSNGNSSGNWSNGNNANKGNYDSLLCKNCSLKGHTIDRCFEIIGYPPGFKRNPNLKPVNNLNSNNSDIRGSSVSNNDKSASPLSLSNEQMMKLMSLLNDKSTAGTANMAVVPKYTVSLLSVNKLIKDSKLSVCFDKSNCYVQDLRKQKVLGTGSEFVGLYLFDEKFNVSPTVCNRNLNLNYIKNDLPCDVCHKAKQSRESFPLSEHKSSVVGQLIHLDVWGPYKVVSREGFRLPSSVLNGKSPFFLVYGREPNLSHLRSFGCLCYVSVVKGSDKFSSKSENNETSSDSGDTPGVNDLNFFDSFESNSSPETPNESPNDDEKGTPIATPIDENNQSEGNVGSSNEVPTFQNVFENQAEEVNLRRSSRVSKLPAKLNDYVLNNTVKYGLKRFVNHSMLSFDNFVFVSNLNKSFEPSSFEEASKDVNWINAMNDEMHALYENDTWELVELPFGRKAIGSKWVYRIKYMSSGEIERFKARLVAKGFNQKEGIDYEETFSPVVKMSTVRCLIDLAVQNDWKLFQMDVNNAFLYGDLSEDVYMLPPPGFFDKDDKRVCKLKRSLYGLKQAPRQWNHKLYETLIEAGFKQSINDHSLYIKNDGGVSLYLLVYVDDLVITGNSESEIEKFKTFLNQKFKIKDLGELKYFLGIEVLKTKNGLCLNQRKYCLELLHEFGLLACRPVVTPLPENIVLSHKETANDKFLQNITAYQKLVGKLIYLCMTRPDISYAVNCLSQHMHSPLQSHFDLGLRLLRYLKLAPVTGYCVFVNGSLVSWKSKRQATLSKSLAEAEYKAMASSVIQIAANPVMHEKTKHFDIDVHLVREKVASGLIKTEKVDSKDQYRPSGIFFLVLPTYFDHLLHGRVPELCPDNYDSEYIPIEGVRNDSESLERGQLGHLGVSPNTNISASMSPLFVDDVCNVKRRRLCRINDVGPSQPTQSQTETQNVVHSLSHSTSISTSTSLPFVDDVGNFK